MGAWSRCVATRLYTFYVTADESTSGWEFYYLFLNPHNTSPPEIAELLREPPLRLLVTRGVCLGFCCIVGSIKVFHRHKPKSWHVYQRAINAFFP